ncbi:MAG: ATP-binding protein [Acidimicrobiales bacterium]
MGQVGQERFVARAAELARLDEAYQRALAGQGSITVILAEAGGGKTRLVEEFAASSIVPAGGRFAWGRAVEDAAVAYRPWRQASRRLDIPFPTAGHRPGGRGRRAGRPPAGDRRRGAGGAGAGLRRGPGRHRPR